MTHIRIRYSQFDLDSLSEFLKEKYDLPLPVQIQFFRNGLNDVYKVTDADENVFYFRVSLSGVHTTADIEEEISVILKCWKEKPCNLGYFSDKQKLK